MRLSRAILVTAAAVLWMFNLGCGNQYRPVANPIPSPGGQPAKLHFAWVVNFNPSGGPGSTTEIDVSGDTNLAVNNMGVGSVAEAFPGPSLELFVANRDNDTVSAYLPTLSSSITTISLLPGSRPVYLASTHAGFMYSLNSGPNSACPNGGSVSEIPVPTLSVSGTACVGPAPSVMAQSSVNAFIYVLNQDGTVSVVDGNVPSFVGTVSGLGQSPGAVATSPDGNWIFVATQGDGVSAGALNIIAAGATTVAATTPVGVRPTFAIPDATLNRLYVVNSGDNTVSVFDTSNITPSGSTPIPLLATVAVGTNPIGLTPLPDGTKFYVANSGSNDVTVVSASSFSPLTSVPLPAGANPAFIATEPTSSKVYVADPGIGATTIIQTSNNAIALNLPAPTQIAGCTSNCALQQPLMVVSQ